MEKLINSFSDQLRTALAAGAKLPTSSSKQIQNVVVAGMGGSAIAANVAQSWLRNSLSVPYEVVRDYRLPSYVNEHTFFIASSCSGNTEETISALDDAIKANAKIHCITSGGKLAELAEEHNYLRASMPIGLPPRSCLGANLVGLLSIFNATGVSDDFLLKEVRDAADLLDQDRSEIQKQAKELAEQLLHTKIIIYPPAMWDSVGLRWKQQFNENSKVQSWHNSIPEMNHNEVVGWKNEQSDFSAVVFESRFTNERTRFRSTIVEELVKRCDSKFFRISTPGKTLVHDTLYLIHLGDFVSLELSKLLGHDPMEIDNLDYVKEQLANW